MEVAPCVCAESRNAGFSQDLLYMHRIFDMRSAVACKNISRIKCSFTDGDGS